ncbi:hypothetical protein MUA04_02685 [Enterobacteriaceae bacterium H11S18]|uniref:hypothetical protein n=1 Tax=Dryocola clanedunensis TaxID=2925396 RepID=UPI0022F11A3B|nr:hypothetical protein [Dryocola clanedunensis]MCT4709114.1 hypothetical protein [Dryocola clanedunensis]
MNNTPATITLPVIPAVLRNVQGLHNLTRIVGLVCRNGSTLCGPKAIPAYFWGVTSGSGVMRVQRYDEQHFTWYCGDQEALKNWFSDYWYPLHAAAVSGDEMAYAAAEFRLAEHNWQQWTLLQAAWMTPEQGNEAAHHAWQYARTVLGELGSLTRLRETVAAGTPVTLNEEMRRLESTLAVAISEPEKTSAAQQAWCEQMFADGLLPAENEHLPAGWPQALVRRFAPVVIALGRLPASGVTTARSLPGFQPVPESHPCARCEHRGQIPDGHRLHSFADIDSGRCGPGDGEVLLPGTDDAARGSVPQKPQGSSGHPDAGEAKDA